MRRIRFSCWPSLEIITWRMLSYAVLRFLVVWGLVLILVELDDVVGEEDDTVVVVAVGGGGEDGLEDGCCESIVCSFSFSCSDVDGVGVGVGDFLLWDGLDLDTFVFVLSLSLSSFLFDVESIVSWFILSIFIKY